MNIVVYTCNASGTLPTFNSGYVYTSNEVDNGNGTYTTTITSESLPTIIKFQGNTNLLSIESIDVSNVTNMSVMFASCSNLTTLDVSNWNTSNVTNMQQMFQYCSSLTTLDVSKWDTSKVNNMNSTFFGCKQLTTLDISEWNTSKVSNMAHMFNTCSKLTSIDVSNWNTSNITNMSCLFHACSNLTTLDVSNWNTSKVTNMSSMFRNCSVLTSLDLSGWVTSAATNMSLMFNGCSELSTLDLSGWDTSAVTDIGSMFRNCLGLTSLDLSGWDTSKVISMSYMFAGCSRLSSLDVSNFIITPSMNTTSIIDSCGNLEQIYMINSDLYTVNIIGRLFDGFIMVSDTFDQTNYTGIATLIAVEPVPPTGVVLYKKSLFLNSPLKEGDTIETIEGKTYHVHRYNMVEPVYELISNEPLVIDSYKNCYLSFNTGVTPSKVEFLNKKIQLNNINPNTVYTLQFSSDNTGEVDVRIGDNIYHIDVVKGVNKILVTTLSNDTLLEIDGIGFNISEISVVETEKDFDYFTGIKHTFNDLIAPITLINEDVHTDIELKLKKPLYKGNRLFTNTNGVFVEYNYEVDGVNLIPIEKRYEKICELMYYNFEYSTFIYKEGFKK